MSVMLYLKLKRYFEILTYYHYYWIYKPVATLAWQTATAIEEYPY